MAERSPTTRFGFTLTGFGVTEGGFTATFGF